jgi:GNAT superfamily N-acetyltransferase
MAVRGRPMADAAAPATVRPLAASDLELARALTDGEEWGNSVRDWERLHALGVGLVAEVDGAAAGVCTAHDYGTLGTVGNVVVAPEQRGRGVGIALVEAALERLAGCRAVRVHALMPTAGFYRALGFEAEGMSSRFRLSPEMHALAPFDVGDAAVAPARDRWDEVLALDAGQFGADRSALLEALTDAVPEAAVALDGGYILAKGEPPLYELGPWVVEPGCRGWRTLLEAAVAALPRTASVEIIVPSPNFRVTSLLEAQGWEAVDYTLAMVRGGSWSDEDNICARAGGDKG